MQGFSISSPSSLAVIDFGKLNMGEFYNNSNNNQNGNYGISGTSFYLKIA